MLSEVVVSIPPFISHLTYAAPKAIVPELDRAFREIVSLDSKSGGRLRSLGQFLIRTESVASSRIEYIEADSDDYARALAGIRSNESATSMVAATNAIQDMVQRAGETGRITMESILAAHHTLMKDDPIDGRYAGELRTVQNWIGGSDYSPRNAIHVPPPVAAIAELMDDLLLFANREDMSAIAQAAIVHAQFESIHPFTDGNGRIGRALINAVLRRRGLTTETVTPLASAMLARRDRYFQLVNNYRTGDVDSFVLYVARSAQIASKAAGISASELEQLPARWADRISVRAGSSAAAILNILLDHPVLSAADVVRLIGGSETGVYLAMERLEVDGIIHEVTARKRGRVWAATDVLGELDELSERISVSVAEESDDTAHVS